MPRADRRLDERVDLIGHRQQRRLAEGRPVEKGQAPLRGLAATSRTTDKQGVALETPAQLEAVDAPFRLSCSVSSESGPALPGGCGRVDKSEANRLELPVGLAQLLDELVLEPPPGLLAVNAAMIASALPACMKPTTRSFFSAHQTQPAVLRAVPLATAGATTDRDRPSLLLSTLGLTLPMTQPIKRLVSCPVLLAGPAAKHERAAIAARCALGRR